MKQIPEVSKIKMLQIISRIDVKNVDVCWPWKGAKYVKTGYGCVIINKKTYGAHRVIAAYVYGPHPDWVEVVMHTCDNPICCNPTHLVYATQSQNVKDAFKKGRAVSGFYIHHLRALGVRNGQAKLTETDVKAIRASKKTHDAIAAEYGVAQATISRIISRISWNHVA